MIWPTHDLAIGDRVETTSGLFTGTIGDIPKNGLWLSIDWDDPDNCPRPKYTWHNDVRKVTT